MPCPAPGTANMSIQSAMEAVLGVLLFLIAILAIGHSSDVKPVQDPLASLMRSQPEDISPSGDLAKTFKFGGDSTDLQRENALEKIKGKVVQWTLLVYDIHKSKNDTYKVQTESHEAIGTFVTITPRADSDRQYLASLKTGDPFTFKGIIDDVTMRNLDIEPAILISDRASVGNAASQQGIPQGNIDQNSQQQQQTTAAAAAYGRQDYQTALELWQPLAEQGDAAAQYNLGGLYQSGQGVPQDYAEALKWYGKSADQGSADAQNSVGFFYSNGLGVAHDYAEALKWFRKAAEQGNAAAQNNLGGLYQNGQGVPQDYAEALKWYRKAADQGFADGQNNLGFMYTNGLGVPKDHAEAAKWYKKADQGATIRMAPSMVLIGSLLFLIGGCYACVRLVRKMRSGTKDTPLRKSDGE